MFTIALLPAQQGDAIWIEYGDANAPRRILIDCGTPATAKLVRRRIELLAEDGRRFELLVVTHIDTDHVGGVLGLLANRPQGLEFGDVWFNAWRHLERVPSSRMGPIDGEILSTALDKLKWPWNAAFDSGPVMMRPEAGGLPSAELPGGMRLTILSPGQDQLRKLRSEWETVVRDAGLDPERPDRAAELLRLAIRKGVGASILGPRRPDVRRLAAKRVTPDSAVANGSSIALLAEYEGKSLLLGADCFPQVMQQAISQLLRDRGQPRLTVDAFKVPHHGSARNITSELLASIRSRRYLISTSGAVFGHPDDAALARIILASGATKPQLYFNYSKDHPIAESLGEWSPVKWDDPSLRRSQGYALSFAGEGGTLIELDGPPR